MQAVVLEEFGAASTLVPGMFADPAPRPGWTVVRLRAAALNWHDVLVREGRYGSPLPHVIGADGAGTVVGTDEPVVILPSLAWGDDETAPGADWEILGDHRPGHIRRTRLRPRRVRVPEARWLRLGRGRRAPAGGRHRLPRPV